MTFLLQQIMSNNCSDEQCDKPEIDGTLLAQRRKVYQRLATSLRTGTAKVFREVKERLSPMSSERLKRALVTTTVTTTSTTKIVKTRERSTTTIRTTTTTAFTTKIATADSVRINPALTTITTIKSVVPSDATEKVFKTTQTTTTTTTTTMTNIDPIGKTTTTVKKTKTRESLVRQLCRNRRHVMYNVN